MDRASLREGRVMREPRIWMAALGGESVYEADLPPCCQRSAREAEDYFECYSCGAMWQQPMPVEPEGDAFSAGRERAAQGRCLIQRVHW